MKSLPKLRSADDRDEALSLVNRELEDLVFEQNEGSETFNFRATVGRRGAA